MKNEHDFDCITFSPVTYQDGHAVISNDSIGLLTSKLFHAIKTDDIHNFEYYLDELKRLNLNLNVYCNERHRFVTSQGDMVMFTLLEFSCLCHAVACVKLLLSMGVDVVTQNKELDTPLHFLQMYPEKRPGTKAHIARLLVKHGADVHLPNAQGALPLDFSFVKKESVSIFSHFFKKKLRHE